jgi:hypothetical protein
MSSNLVFHRVRIGGVDFEASVLADGPALVVRGHEGRRYAGWAVLGVSHLHWFESEEPGFASPRGKGWHLVKYSNEVRAYLPGFGEAEVRRMREEFGLLTDAEPGRLDEAFYASRAWAALVQWVAAHPQLARRHAHSQAYLPGWHERAQQAARARRATPA